MGSHLSDMGRFTESALLILLSLAGGDKHGYAIMDDIQQSFGVQVGPGTLYGALARLEREALIEALPSTDRRRPYRLTQLGGTALRTHLHTMERLSAMGLERLTSS